MATHRIADETTHVGVHRLQHLGVRLEDGHRAPPVQERLGDLETDVAATDDGHRRA